MRAGTLFGPASKARRSNTSSAISSRRCSTNCDPWSGWGTFSGWWRFRATRYVAPGPNELTGVPRINREGRGGGEHEYGTHDRQPDARLAFQIFSLNRAK